jgi:hypothetical protein
LAFFDGRLLQVVGDPRLEGAIELPDHLLGILAAVILNQQAGGGPVGIARVHHRLRIFRMRRWRNVLPIAGRRRDIRRQRAASFLDRGQLFVSRLDLEFVALAHLLGVHPRARIRHLEHFVDPVLQDLDTPIAAADLGRYDALGDRSDQLLYARRNKLI